MVTVKSLDFGYRKGIKLFDSLNLSLEKGNIYGLFGVNGAGKTTLIRHIVGLLFPKGGEVLVNERVAQLRQVEMYQDIFVIPEEFELPSISVAKYTKIHAGFYPNFDNSTFESILKELDVNNGQNLEHLSYGQKKKFLIAFGIATNTGLLLMDEPTNGLDIPSKSQFRKIMAKYINESRCVLISTHQVRDLSSIIDHVIILDNGRIRFKESIPTIMEHLSFGLLPDLNENVIYAEDVFGGKAAITFNKGKDTDIDFELLFNAVVKNADNINNAIQRRL